MRRVDQTVSMVDAEKRALTYLKRQGPKSFTKANSVAGAIWPGVQFTAQGAGGAASRVLRSLQKQKLAKWHTNNDGTDWGWDYGC